MHRQSNPILSSVECVRVHFGGCLSQITSNRNTATLEIKKPGEQQKVEEVVRLSTDTLDFLY